MKPYLALFRAGPHSLHRSVVRGATDRNFDYALSWFGDEPPVAVDDAVFVHRCAGPKWAGLDKTLALHWDTIQRYRYVWLPDDDLLAEPGNVSRLFSICDDLKLELAQPALTPDSYFSHVITLQHCGFRVRFTDFVEIMAPVFEAAMLARVYPTLRNQISGWGLDSVWPQFSSLGRVAIIDDAPVTHTRPIGGPNYDFSKKAGVPPLFEKWMMRAAHFIQAPWTRHINFAGLLQDGTPICIGSTNTEIETMLAALLKSGNALRLTALQQTRYLSDHLHYWANGDPAQNRYPRTILRTILNRALKHRGISFSNPKQDVANENGANEDTQGMQLSRTTGAGGAGPSAALNEPE
jgi:hypothetical protein